MKIQQIKSGPLDNFIYIVSNGKKCFIVDPAWDPQKIKKQIFDENLELSFILLTHLHPDHINAVNYLLNNYPKSDLYYHKNDEFMLDQTFKKARYIKEGSRLDFANEKISVLNTPGHTPGSCCYLIKNHLFTGDTLFINACGRTDLPKSSHIQMTESLVRLSKLPDGIIVHPGHAYNGFKTTIKNEKENNVYVRLALKEISSSGKT